MNISEGLEPECMRRWRFLKQESSELERLSAVLSGIFRCRTSAAVCFGQAGSDGAFYFGDRWVPSAGAPVFGFLFSESGVSQGHLYVLFPGFDQLCLGGGLQRGYGVSEKGYTEIWSGSTSQKVVEGQKLTEGQKFTEGKKGNRESLCRLEK